MRTFQLDNVVKKTDNEVKAERYLALGFKEIDVEETKQQPEQQKQAENTDLTELEVKQLKELADEKGVEYAKNATKEQMLELLEE